MRRCLRRSRASKTCCGEANRHGRPIQRVFPTTVIPKSVQRYLFTKEAGKARALDVDRYEFLVYRLLRNALEAGNVFVRESTEFRRFEDDLISDARWQDKEAVLREIGAPLLLAPIHGHVAGVPRKPGRQVHRRQSAHR